MGKMAKKEKADGKLEVTETGVQAQIMKRKRLQAATARTKMHNATAMVQDLSRVKGEPAAFGEDMVCPEEIFSMFDADNTGRISLSNLRQVAKELGYDIDEKALRAMIATADRDGDGQIDNKEFYRIVKCAVDAGCCDPLEEAFRK